jgi:hypothetical protein
MPTTQLVKVPMASINSDKKGVIEKKVYHESFSGLAQKCKNLRPRHFFESLETRAWESAVHTRNRSCSLVPISWLYVKPVT